MRTEDEARGDAAGVPLGVGPRAADLVRLAPDSEACLSEEQVLAFSDGTLMPAQLDFVHTHLDRCPLCLELVNAAVHQWAQPPICPLPGERAWMATFGVGQFIGGRYRIERFVGRGGMGEVYLAFDDVLSERVALKTLISTLSDNPTATRRLLSEARLARRVSHPNVCRVHDVGVHDEPGRVDERLLFLTMEFIEGQRLGQLLGAAPLEIPLVLRIARQILAGLSAAHRAGVLHRDLKSDNVMLSGQGEQLRIVITDFGLSQALGASQRDGIGLERVGSISYMAPEQILGGELSPATDLFAFGVVLFEMLCGQLPFAPVGARRQTAASRLSQRAFAPSRLRPELDPGLDRLVLRCLEESARERIASAEQALALLDAADCAARPSAIYPKLRSGPRGAPEASGVAAVRGGASAEWCGPRDTLDVPRVATRNER